MAIFKIIDESYSDPEDIRREIYYILNPSKCIHMNTSNLVFEEPILLTHQFLYIKNYFGKTSGRQLEHFVLSLDSEVEEEDVPVKSLIIISECFIAEFKEYQIIYAIHNNKTNLHTHFIMNSVNMRTGKHFHLSKTELNSFMCKIAEILFTQNIALKGYTFYDKQGRIHKGQNNDPCLYSNKAPKFTF